MTPIDTIAPRSCLCVPADDARKLQKALASAADQVVVDLEDAVAPGRKEVARAGVGRIHPVRPLLDIVVRINGLDTPWWRDDLAGLFGRGSAVSGVVVPKAEDVDQLRLLERELLQLEAGSGRRLALHLLVESARGLVELDRLLASSGRVVSVILGYADMAVSLNRPLGGPAAPYWLPVQNHILVLARAHGVQAIDGPWFDFRDTASGDAANAHASAMGFDGKWVIHPSQIDGVNAAFTPGADAVRRAQRIVQAFRSAGDDAVIAVDGTMVDKPVVEAARRLLARNDQCEDQ